ncbi:MTMR5 protein, partial [Panurus biarmicus]|nr:MTMR5 protein [Panurus biarmicus]
GAGVGRVGEAGSPLSPLPSLPQFCQPSGWQLFPERNPPSFFVAVLTDINSERHYCACFTFWEAVESPQPGISHPCGRGRAGAGIARVCVWPGTSPGSVPSPWPCSSVLCSPLQNSLGLIYTIYVDGLSVSLENVIGNLLTCTIPITGGAQ